MNAPAADQRPLHPYCRFCGWRKGGPDSWDGKRCKCGHAEPPMTPPAERVAECRCCAAARGGQHFGWCPAARR